MTDWVLFGLLLLPAAGGMVLYGGVRLWMSTPFILGVYGVTALLVLGGLIHRGAVPLRVAPGLIGLGAFVLYLVAWIPFAPVPLEAWIALFKGSSYLLAYAGITILAARRGSWRASVAAVLAVGSLLALYALVQHANGSMQVLFQVRPEQYRMRASGTYLCPNHFGHVLAVLVVLAGGAMITRGAGWPLRLLSGYVVLVSLPALLLTGSRSAWVGLAAGLIVFAALLALRRGVLRFLLVSFCALLLAAACAGALYHFSDVFQDRVDRVRGDKGFRLAVCADTIKAIRDQPWLGHGPGTFRYIYPHYKEAWRDPKGYPRFTHNEYLNLLSDYGIVGAFLLMVAVCGGAWRFLGALLSGEGEPVVPLTAALGGAWAATFAHIVFDFNLHIFANVHLLMLLTGTVAGVLYSRGLWPARTTVSRVACLVPGLGALVCCVVLAVMVARTVLSLHAADEAERLRTEELDVDAALARADAAVAHFPLTWQAHRERGNVLMTKSTWHHDLDERKVLARETIEAYLESVRLNPFDMHSKHDASRVYGDVLGDQETALALMREIVAYLPRHYHFQAQLGLRLRRMGMDQEALEVFKEARRLNWHDEMSKLNIRSLEKKLAPKKPAPGAKKAPAQPRPAS